MTFILHVVFASIATARGHGFAPWVVFGLVYAAVHVLGYIFGGMGMHPRAIYNFGNMAGWALVFFLGAMALSAPAKDDDHD